MGPLQAIFLLKLLNTIILKSRLNTPIVYKIYFNILSSNISLEEYPYYT